MADPLGADADRIARGKRRGHGGEHLGVLRCVNALIELAIDRYRTGRFEQRPQCGLEQRGLREKADVAAGGRPDQRRIEQRVGMIGEEEDGAVGGRGADLIDAIEDAAHHACEPAEGGIGAPAHDTAASARRAARRPSSTLTNASRNPPTMKNASTARMALRLSPVASTMTANTSGPSTPAYRSNTPK